MRFPSIRKCKSGVDIQHYHWKASIYVDRHQIEDQSINNRKGRLEKKEKKNVKKRQLRVMYSYNCVPVKLFQDGQDSFPGASNRVEIQSSLSLSSFSPRFGSAGW